MPLRINLVLIFLLRLKGGKTHAADDRAKLAQAKAKISFFAKKMKGFS